MGEVSIKNLGIGEMIKLGLILVCYAVASCTVLAIVNNFTSAKIYENQTKKANAAMKTVFVDADDFSPIEKVFSVSNSAITLSNAYYAKKSDEIIGAVIQVAGPTYDKSKIIVGLKKDFTISGIQFLENTDSPGFGQKASDTTFTLPNGKTFYGQFEGKSAIKNLEISKDFDAISGATITSKAVGDLINEGCAALKEILK